MHIIVALALGGALQGNSPSVEAIQQILLESYDRLGGVSFEYEGREYTFNARSSTKLGDERMSFTGAFALGSEHRALRLELYCFFVDPKNAINNVHKVIVCRDAKKEVVTEGPYGNQGGEVGVNWAHAFDEPGSLENIMPVNAIRCYFTDTNYETKLDGVESVDGHACYKLAVHSRPDTARKRRPVNSLIVVYWLDLERGALPLKIDWYLNRPKLHSRAVDIVLKSFEFPDKELWLPVEGKVGPVDEDGSFAPTQHIQVLQRSVRLSQLSPDRFKASFKPGTPITDQLRRARYEFGQDLRAPAPTRGEAEKRLIEHVAEADAQKTALDASRTANEGVDWVYPLALAVTSTCVIALLIMLLRRR
jgi:hypothetical protein